MKEKETAQPPVSLARLVKAADADQAGGKDRSYPDGVHLVCKALLELGFVTSQHDDDGRFGAGLLVGYAALQRSLDTPAHEATGVPDKDSLKHLADTTHLFTAAR